VSSPGPHAERRTVLKTELQRRVHDRHGNRRPRQSRVDVSIQGIFRVRSNGLNEPFLVDRHAVVGGPYIPMA
jgi:hypothetical protein